MAPLKTVSKIACAVVFISVVGLGVMTVVGGVPANTAPTPQEVSAAKLFATAALAPTVKDTKMTYMSCALGLFDCKQREIGPMSAETCDGVAALIKSGSHEPWYRKVNIVCLPK